MSFARPLLFARSLRLDPRNLMASPAPAAQQALDDAFKAYPTRQGYEMVWDRKAKKWKKEYSDGIMGDQSHKARKSDHNQGNAVDIRHDVKGGSHGDTIAAYAIRDPRTKYVIWNHRIYTPGKGWKRYTGTNPHTKHVHISIKAAARGDTSPWGWAKNLPEGDPVPSINVEGETKFEDAAPLPKKAPAKKAAPKKGPQKRADAANTGSSGRFRLVQGYHGVVLQGSQNMAAHVDTPHTGGGRVAQASKTVFVGPGIKGFARIGDPTTDNYGVVEGVPSVLVG
jgi:hypothetical protein